MRLLLAVAFAALAATALSGCASSPAVAADLAPTEAVSAPGARLGDEPAPALEASAEGSHGQYRREDSAVETGTDPASVPMAYARKTVTITNDFGGAPRGVVAVGVDSGSILVRPGNEEGYRIEAVLEARGMTEVDAAEALAKLDITHSDQIRGDALHLATETVREEDVQPVPGVMISLGNSQAWADITVYLPVRPTYDLVADAGSGDITLQELRGTSFAASTGSGDVLAKGLDAGAVAFGTGSGDVGLDNVEAAAAVLDTGSGEISAAGVRFGKLQADTGSGDITLKGQVDTMEADTGSGSIRLDVHARRSGAYTLDAGSGEIDVKLLDGKGQAYRVTADSGSGSVDVDLPNSRTTASDEEDGYVKVESRDFDDARIQTILEVETGSGDITVRA